MLGFKIEFSGPKSIKLDLRLYDNSDLKIYLIQMLYQKIKNLSS
jgi:hypothetical protein